MGKICVRICLRLVVSLLFAACLGVVTVAAPTITELVGFSAAADGSDPQFLMQSSDGNLYGTVYRGGGSVFAISSSGMFTLLHRFVSDPVSGQYVDGEYPTDLADPGNGYLYGIATSGGPLSDPTAGNIYRVSKSGSGFEVVHRFCSAPNCSDGSNPSSLILASDGNMYGIAGVMFRLSPSGTYTVMSLNPNNIAFGLALEATDGNFYGICEIETGGHPGVCRVTKSGQLTTVFTFPSTVWPRTISTQGSDGFLYGTVTIGNNAQAIFKVSTSGTGFQQLLQTPIQCCVKESFSRVVEASDGNLWVTNPNAQLYGTVYSETPSGTLLQTVPFGGRTNGAAPTFLIQGFGGLLFGTTYGGGTGGAGTVFSINAGLPAK